MRNGAVPSSFLTLAHKRKGSISNSACEMVEPHRAKIADSRSAQGLEVMLELDPPHTLKGLLQRGRGEGFLQAERKKGPHIRDLLVECVTSDPRWDHQVDSRSLFYGDLLLALRVPLAPLRRHLLENDAPDDREWRTTLTITTLGVLARRGIREAEGILREHLEAGDTWHLALEELLRTPSFSPGVLDIALTRVASRDELVDLVTWRDAALEPWRSWRQAHPRVDEAFAEAAALRETRARREAELSQMATHNLLSDVAAFTARDIGRVLAARAELPSDELIRIARDGSFGAIAVALFALTLRRHPERLAPAVAVLEGKDVPLYVEIVASHALRDLDDEAIRPVIHRWLASTNEKVRRLGISLLPHYATPSDATRIRELLAYSAGDEETYELTNLVEALGRLPDAGPFPELGPLFEQVHYSYARTLIAKAMASTSRATLFKYKQEMLWDAEPGVRTVGIHAAELSETAVNTRLRAIAKDELEEEEVRMAAVEVLRR